MAFETHLVLEARQCYPENLKQCLESIVWQFNPPLLQNRPVHVLQHPQEANEKVPRGVLLQYVGSLGIVRNNVQDHVQVLVLSTTSHNSNFTLHGPGEQLGQVVNDDGNDWEVQIGNT